MTQKITIQNRTEQRRKKNITTINKKKSEKKTVYISQRHNRFSREMTSEKRGQRVTTQVWIAFLIGRAAWEICFRQSKSEYACPVFHKVLPAYLSAELEQLQKRAMRIIFPFVPYSDALHQANLETLSRRRQSITTKLFDSITCNSDHKLHELLPPRNNCESNLRRKRNFNVPLAKTKRLKNTFIYSNCN